MRGICTAIVIFVLVADATQAAAQPAGAGFGIMPFVERVEAVALYHGAVHRRDVTDPAFTTDFSVDAGAMTLRGAAVTYGDGRWTVFAEAAGGQGHGHIDACPRANVMCGVLEPHRSEVSMRRLTVGLERTLLAPRGRIPGLAVHLAGTGTRVDIARDTPNTDEGSVDRFDNPGAELGLTFLVPLTTRIGLRLRTASAALRTDTRGLKAIAAQDWLGIEPDRYDSDATWARTFRFGAGVSLRR